MSKGQKRPLDPVLAKAIYKSISIGGGSIDNFSVNGKLLHKRVTWKVYCVIDPSYGGFICDNKLIQPLKPSDKWHADRMDNDAIVMHGIDSNLITENIEALKKRTAKKGKIIHF